MTHITIKNTVGRLVILRLNSGRTLFIDPNTVSAAVAESEIRGNAMFTKLRQRGYVNMITGENPTKPKEETEPTVPAAPVKTRTATTKTTEITETSEKSETTETTETTETKKTTKKPLKKTGGK